MLLRYWESLAVSYKVTYTFPMTQPFNSQVCIYTQYINSRESKTLVYEETCTWIFVAAWEEPETGNNKNFHQQNGYTDCSILMEHHSAKPKEWSTDTQNKMDASIKTMLSKRRQMQKSSCHMIFDT